MLTALIYLSLALIVAALAVMLFFGVRNLARSSENKLVLITGLVPIALFGLLYVVYGDAERALVMTALGMAAVAALALVGSAARGFVR